MQIVNLLSGCSFDDVLNHAKYAIEQILITSLNEAVDICCEAEHLFYVGRRGVLSGNDGGCPEDEGDLLHSCRGICSRGIEAWSVCSFNVAKHR